MSRPVGHGDAGSSTVRPRPGSRRRGCESATGFRRGDTTCGSRPPTGPVRALVLSAPRRCPQPDGRWWGVFAPLYALRAEDDWGVGSFSELATFRGWIDGLGGSVAATLPLFAQFLDEPMVEPSPYSPASRLFWNETYIDVTRAPGLDGCDEAREALDDPSLRRAARPAAQERALRPSGGRRREATRPRPRRAAGVPRARSRPVLSEFAAEPAGRRLRAVPRGGGATRGVVGRVAADRSVRARSPGRRSTTTGRATTCSSSGWRPSSCRRPPAARARPAA